MARNDCIDLVDGVTSVEAPAHDFAGVGGPLTAQACAIAIADVALRRTRTPPARHAVFAGRR